MSRRTTSVAEMKKAGEGWYSGWRVMVLGMFAARVWSPAR
jgi:hypothetical protein